MELERETELKKTRVEGLDVGGAGLSMFQWMDLRAGGKIVEAKLLDMAIWHQRSLNVAF